MTSEGTLRKKCLKGGWDRLLAPHPSSLISRARFLIGDWPSNRSSSNRRAPFCFRMRRVRNHWKLHLFVVALSSILWAVMHSSVALRATCHAPEAVARSLPVFKRIARSVICRTADLASPRSVAVGSTSRRSVLSAGTALLASTGRCSGFFLGKSSFRMSHGGPRSRAPWGMRATLPLRFPTLLFPPPIPSPVQSPPAR